MSSFKQKFLFSKRLEESTKIRNKFPGRIPVIVERGARSNVPEIDKHKYLVPSDLSIGQFIFIIRKRLTLSPETALFVYINNSLPTTSALMREVYVQHQDLDGFLYVQYTGENTFGYSNNLIKN
jgi:GABA(A) receptor-associated protein